MTWFSSETQKSENFRKNFLVEISKFQGRIIILSLINKPH